MKISQEQQRAILALPGPDRYRHFIKVVCDRGEVWGLYEDGWAMVANDDGDALFPLWPAEEYARLCATREWSQYQPEAFSLDDFVTDLLPHLESLGAFPSVFLTPSDFGVTPTIDQLVADINRELENYM